jgi:hypothetical protein
MYRPSCVPDNATVRRVQADFFHETFIWTWTTDTGEKMGYSMPVTPQMAAEVERYEIFEYGSAAPVVIPNVGFSTPLPRKSVEPPSLFAKRELTEDELLDPGLFCKSVYEPVLDTIVR